MKRYMNMPDTRPLDDWGVPIGQPYDKKTWDSLTSDEMMADFEWKSDVLAAHGEAVDQEVFYQDYLFRELVDESVELGEEYRVILTEYDADKGKKVHKLKVDEIGEYLHLNDVALSPCLFHKNWRRKNLLNYVTAFVLDIDKLRPQNLQLFFKRFEDGRLLTPTFIANSGSGVHFYYLLDTMYPVYVGEYAANNQIAEKIYHALYDDVILKEKWRAAQRHWIGQDYRVVNSKTKLGLTSQIFKIGDTYTIEQLIEYYGITIDAKKSFATPKMVKYAQNIAKELKIDNPDFEDSKETYEFIKLYKDDAYESRMKRKAAREARVKKKYNKKPVTWYANTLNYMRDHTQAGYRFTSMKALAKIARIEDVKRDDFVGDLYELAAYWQQADWRGDDFNVKNVEAIIRFFDNAEKYNVSAETLEDWLGYEFRRIGTKRNGRKQKDHLVVMNRMKEIKKELGEEIKEGRPQGSGTAEQKVIDWRVAHPDGIKSDCHRDTGLSRVTINKWWNSYVPKFQHDAEGHIVVPIRPSKDLSNLITKMMAEED